MRMESPSNNLRSFEKAASIKQTSSSIKKKEQNKQSDASTLKRQSQLVINDPLQNDDKHHMKVSNSSIESLRRSA